MRKAPIIFLLVISLVWHSFATANVSAAYEHGEGAAHAAMHLENEPHHHHDDGTLQQDGSDESVKHVYADGCANSAGVMPAHFAALFDDLRAGAQFSNSATAHPPPVLEGLRRPPRLTV